MAKNFTIVLNGGLVQAVIADDPEMIGVGFDIIDYDTEGASEENLRDVSQNDGLVAKAYISGGYVEKAEIKILDGGDDETHASS